MWYDKICHGRKGIRIRLDRQDLSGGTTGKFYLTVQRYRPGEFHDARRRHRFTRDIIPDPISDLRGQGITTRPVTVAPENESRDEHGKAGETPDTPVLGEDGVRHLDER